VWLAAPYSEFARPRLCRALALLLVLAAPSLLGACSIAKLGAGGEARQFRADGPTGAVARQMPPMLAPELALGRQDWTAAQSTLVTALAATAPTSLSWINSASGTMGTVSTAQSGAGRCRGFDLTVFRNAASERLSGEACRRGREWRVAGLRRARLDH